MEKVDILLPPTFKKSGKIKTKQQAWEDEDWIGAFNLWIIQNIPVPAIVYQQRSPNSSWAPNKLDVTAGGHYHAGEKISGGLSVNDIFMVLDNSPLGSYRLEKVEVYAICACPIDELIKAHTKKGYSFWVEGLTSKGEKIKIKVSKKSFPYNWDNYHFKIALLAGRFIKGEKKLIY